MSFKKLYDPCFKNISLVKICHQLQPNESNGPEKCLTTLGNVFKTNAYVIFAIVQSNSPIFHEIISSLQKIIKSRRSKTTLPVNR